MNKKIALIPLRGGSKGIKNKNLKLFAGSPLCSHVLTSAINCDEIDEVWVSSEDEKILDYVRINFKKVKLFKRSKLFATDTASTESVVLEFIDKVNIDNNDDIILIQATSPFTTSTMLNEAILMYKAQQNDSLISVVADKRFYWNKNGTPVNYDPSCRPRRQDFNGLMMENGAFYISSAGAYRKFNNRISGKVGLYVMPSYSGHELDEPIDWVIMENIAKKYL